MGVLFYSFEGRGAAVIIGRPLIGVVCGHQEDPERFYVNAPYLWALQRAGGIPVLICHLPEDDLYALLSTFDGILLPGGIDVDPARYGEQPHPNCGEIDPLWDELDLTVARWALDNRLPLLAICRGMQVLNVAAGGTLIQDIPSQVPNNIKHSQQAPRWYATHDIYIEQGSLLESVIRELTTTVNSYHHQAVRDVGEGLRVSASAFDGVIEALEGTSTHFVLGVQWHPEHMVGRYPSAQRIFSAFIEAARNGQESQP